MNIGKWQIIFWANWFWRKGVFPESAKKDKSKLVFKYWWIGFIEIRKYKV